MMFDPDKVERWDSDGSPMISSYDSKAFADGRFVLAKDYHQLLAMYGTVCELLRITQSYVDNPPKP